MRLTLNSTSSIDLLFVPFNFSNELLLSSDFLVVVCLDLLVESLFISKSGVKSLFYLLLEGSFFSYCLIVVGCKLLFELRLSLSLFLVMNF